MLQKYIEREGNTRVSQGYKEGEFKLGNWVNNQRAFKRKGMLSEDRIQRLEELSGWIWDVLEEAWEEGFAVLQKYVEREGDARVSAKHKEGEFSLGQWVKSQRRSKNKGQISEDHVQCLEELSGWTWNTFETAWEEGFAVLQKYVERHGDARVSQSYEEDKFWLGRWVSGQRTVKNKGKISEDRARRLEALPGWVWNAREDMR